MREFNAGGSAIVCPEFLEKLYEHIGNDSLSGSVGFA
jgi:hypothetical protein